MHSDLKIAPSRPYSGAPVGLVHRWRYDSARWTETKLTPDRWAFGLRAVKRRVEMAPEASGASVGSKYAWTVLGVQRVEKMDANTYATFLRGVKFLTGYKRPDRRVCSTSYKGRPTERQHLIAQLRATLGALESAERAGGPPQELYELAIGDPPQVWTP